MKKGNEKKYAFAFEEFLEINSIELKDLPEDIQMMISTIRKRETANKEHCTKVHYKLLKERFQKYADIVEDYLMQHFDDRLMHNTIEEEQEEKELKKATEQEVKETKQSKRETMNIDTPLKKQVRLILQWAAKKDRNFLLSTELRDLGIEMDFESKEVLIDDLRLERELGTARWYLGINPKEMEVKP